MPTSGQFILSINRHCSAHISPRPSRPVARPMHHSQAAHERVAVAAVATTAALVALLLHQAQCLTCVGLVLCVMGGLRGLRRDSCCWQCCMAALTLAWLGALCVYQAPSRDRAGVARGGGREY